MVDEDKIKKVKEVKKEHEEEFLKKKNVVGTGVGIREETGEEAIIVFVEKKESLEDLKKKDVVPAYKKGVPTKVIEVGKFRALGTIKKDDGRRGIMRPAKPGCSIGHRLTTAGTFGLVVYDVCDIEKKNPLVLSNCHVLALSNRAKIGDLIVQPGTWDKPFSLKSRFGTLVKFIPIKFPVAPSICPVSNAVSKFLNGVSKLFRRQSRFSVTAESQSVNYVDCALAKPFIPDMVSDEILDIGKPNGIAEPRIGERIKKSGRTTYYTEGTLITVESTIKIEYDFGMKATFKNQIIARGDKDKLICSSGDSGSSVLNKDNKVIGLLFAGSDSANMLIANQIDDVFNGLNITL